MGDSLDEALELLNEGEVAAAQERLRALARVEPLNADVHFHLGRALAAGGQFGPATVAFRMAIRFAPEFLGARLQLALCERELGALSDAIASAEAALALREDDPEVLHALGVCHAERAQAGDFERARRYLERAVGARGLSAEARFDAELLLKAVTLKVS